MRSGDFIKGAFAGGVGAAAMMTATVALAGTGVGGIFNLGVTNTVDETTTLNGSKAGPLLDVTNTNLNGQATAARFLTQPGRAPFVVTSSSQVKLLNADQIDGYSASSLNRGTISAANDSIQGGAEQVVRTVTIRTSVNGFVKVDADVSIADANIGYAGGQVAMVIRHENTGARSVESHSTLPGVGTAGVTSLSRTWMVAVPAGEHTFAMLVQPFPAVLARNESLVAQAQPFGWNGTSELTKPPSVSASRAKQKDR